MSVPASASEEAPIEIGSSPGQVAPAAAQGVTGSPSDQAVQDAAETVVDIAGEQDGTLRVTTWNVLAPLMGGERMFPGISEDIHSQEARRPVLQRQLLSLNSDVVLLQEIRKVELARLLHEGETPLVSFFESHYVADRRSQAPEATSASDAGTVLASGDGTVISSDDTERGVAILWRHGVLTNVAASAKDLGPGGPPSLAILHATVTAWAEDVIFATAHLDGDSPIPAVARSQQQLLQVLDATNALTQASSCSALIWGGDANCTSYASALRKVSRHNFCIASGYPREPSCFSVITSARLDHILARGSVEAKATEIPGCPINAYCLCACFFHPSQLMFDCLGCSDPKVKVPMWQRCFLGICFIPWFLAALCSFVPQLARSKHRCKWALQEWGSDHVPVTVIFGKRQAAEPSSDIALPQQC